MADSFKLQGSYETTPLGQPTSFAASIVAPISESKTLRAKQLEDVNLGVDSPVSVPFGGVTSAHIVIMRAVGGKVKARITSADGTNQAVPFDTYWILMSESVPLTAIDLTRTPGTETTVRVFLGEKA
jgi:hypothetical protein